MNSQNEFSPAAPIEKFNKLQQNLSHPSNLINRAQISLFLEFDINK
jgi:hypothetical protein